MLYCKEMNLYEVKAEITDTLPMEHVPQHGLMGVCLITQSHPSALCPAIASDYTLSYTLPAWLHGLLHASMACCIPALEGARMPRQHAQNNDFVQGCSEPRGNLSCA